MITNGGAALLYMVIEHFKDQDPGPQFTNASRIMVGWLQQGCTTYQAGSMKSLNDAF
jgi:hypothetical protein